mmetsp:Transcript_8/g.27  ORF Transcript_8/g.27 Transcript_8/m.27 type:complete len:80 (+) Transcript_8:560-799(+)
MAKILDSKWTALESTFGFNYTAIHKKKEGNNTYALMIAACDRSTKFWVGAFAPIALLCTPPMMSISLSLQYFCCFPCFL